MRARIAAAVVLAGASCSGDDGPNRLTPTDADPTDPYRVVLEVPVTVIRAIDLLFIVDDSPSMADKQNNLAANFPSFIGPLASAPGGLPDLHIGVVTTDVGTLASDGTTAPAFGVDGQGGCSGRGNQGELTTSGAPVSGVFVSDSKQSDGTRVRNYTGSLEQVFSTMVRVGAGGCGFEQPLAAMKLALASNNPVNAGFVRSDANLAVVFVTDEDDCSAKTSTVFGPASPALGPLFSFRCTRFGVTCTNGGNSPDEMNSVGVKTGCRPNPSSMYLDEVSPFVDLLHGLKSAPNKIVVASISGTPSPVETILTTPAGSDAPVPTLEHSCRYQGATGEEVADPAVRLDAFARAFGPRGVSSSICQANLSSELALVGARVANLVGSSCIAIALGSPPDCIAEDVDGSAVTPLSACDASGTPPCWRLVDDVSCQTGDRLSLQVERVEAPPPSTVVRLRCRVP